MVSVKQKRLEGIIRKNISEIIQFGVKDPDVGCYNYGCSGFK